MTMLYWAAIPLETVFEGFDSTSYNWLETDYQRVKMIVEPCGNGWGKIVRLLSANPYDYMDPRLSPGSLVPIASLT
ncbi:YlzJ-like family protein [Effusibacillus dendaii]|uniref:YlzJ-like protein n=1 Tax=Effusibacillus dendaii TaxID=2743772 RepID=A0A7I8D8J0_9BACL|nr:YlzJ-like family protein [Effusibacillus dendaii]BCJ85329.1 hypothetical protein skT53_03140 [Effusibacillus dendaii]